MGWRQINKGQRKGKCPLQDFQTSPKEQLVPSAAWQPLPPVLPPPLLQPPPPQVVGFVPTGWLYEMRRERFSVRSKGACSVHLVPYSEHSSYAELLEYVKWLHPHQVRCAAVPAVCLLCLLCPLCACAELLEDVPCAGSALRCSLCFCAWHHPPLLHQVDPAAWFLLPALGLLLQVLPTVGVEGEDADKAREKMQRHFRGLGER